MSGLSGLVSPRNVDAMRSEEVLNAFSRVQAVPGAMAVERRIALGNAAISLSLTGILEGSLDQPASDRARGVHLFLEGEVYNTDEIERILDAPSGSPPLRSLLALYIDRGPEMAPLLDGSFNMAVWEEGRGRLTLLNDRFSIKPLYYLEERGSLLFASEKKAILAAREGSARIDPLGILQIFAHRHHVAQRTFIEGIRRLPPGSCLEWEGGRTTVRSLERLRYSAPSRLRRVPDLIEEWCERLRADVARRVRGKRRVLLFLSGGLDSRAVACAIPREFRPVASRTRGPADSLEAICGSQVAERLGFEHFRDDPEALPYSTILERAAWRAECEVSLLSCMSLADHDRIKAHGDVIFGGHSGEVPAGEHIYPYMLLPRGRQAFLDRVWQAYSLYPEGVLRRVFQPDFVRKHLPVVRDEFRASFEFQDGESNIDAYQIWDLRERQPRLTLASGPVDSPLFEKVYALLGRDYVDFALELPLRLRYGAALYHAMIWRLGPEVRDVPYANTGMRIRRTIRGNAALEGIHLGRQAAKRVLRKLRRRKTQVRAAAIQNVPSAIRSDPGIRRAIERYLGSSGFEGSIFNREGIRSLLDEHQAGRADHASLICLFATYAVGIPWLVHERPRSCPYGVPVHPPAVEVE